MDYKEQVETIMTVIGNCSPKDDNDLDSLLMGYITDMSYQRSAICEARKRLLKDIKGEKE